MTLTDAAASPPASGATPTTMNPMTANSSDFYLPDDNVTSLTEQLYGHHLQPSSHQQSHLHATSNAHSGSHSTATPGSHSNSNWNSVVAPQNTAKLRRDSIAHSQGMGGVSWGSLTIGSWLRDEVMFHTNAKNSRSNSVSRNGSINLSSTNVIPTSNSRRPSHYRSSASPPSAYNSYLPNLEKQYCKDYSCCGLSLPGLHDLLRHYEEAHIATSPGSSTANIMQNSANQNTNTQKRRTYQAQGSSAGIPRPPPQQQQQQQQKPTHQHIIQQQLHQRNNQQQTPPPSQQQQQQSRMTTSPSTIGTTHTSINVTSAGHNPTNITTTTSTNSNGQLSQAPQLHLNGNLVDAVSTNDVFLQANANQLTNVNRRHDTIQNTANNGAHNGGKIPITPQHSFNTYSLNMPSNKTGQHQSNKMNGGHIHNPNLHLNGNQNKTLKFSSSISNGMEFDFMDEDLIGSDLDDNTPAFMRLGNANTSHQPQSSLITNTSKNTMMNMPRVHHPTPPPSTTTGSVALHIMHDEEDDDDDDDEDDDDDDDEDDDDMSRGASNLSQAKNADRNVNRQGGYIHDPARRLYVMDHEEHKPFKCPVIGCDKTYKNQNGLKYHKLHGHQNQKLHENPDGTFSIIDPESNEPYPDGMGYEKDKPYRCEVCGKRYKNLNGLKYHRGHSTH